MVFSAGRINFLEFVFAQERHVRINHSDSPILIISYSSCCTGAGSYKHAIKHICSTPWISNNSMKSRDIRLTLNPGVLPNRVISSCQIGQWKVGQNMAGMLEGTPGLRRGRIGSAGIHHILIPPGSESYICGSLKIGASNSTEGTEDG